MNYDSAAAYDSTALYEGGPVTLPPASVNDPVRVVRTRSDAAAVTRVQNDAVRASRTRNDAVAVN